MFRPYIKQTRILVLIASINLLLVYISYNSYEYKPSTNYNLKIKASKLMSDALIHTEILYNDLVVRDSIKNVSSDFDRFHSGIIGVDSILSQITTKRGNIKSKVATTNPNFSALFVQLFSEIDSSLTDTSKPDTIAVSYTGSFPGANIALLSACKAMNIYPVIISSIGASSWGANRFDMTWIDIENYLFNRVFNFKSVAVSLGGDEDRAVELALDIRDSLKKKILSYNYNLIYEQSLQESIDKRIKEYDIEKINYKAYVTIGGSAASLGDSTTVKMYLPGLIYGKNPDIEEAMGEDFIDEATIEPVVEFFLNKLNIPVINIRNINNLCEWYDLPYRNDDYNTLNTTIGFGNLFGEQTYHHRLVVRICLLISLSILIWVVASSIDQVNKKMKEIHNEPVE